MLGLLLLLAACDFHEEPADWHDQLQPDSPCYRVDLFDGLSESSTDELHDLFDCVNQGNLDPLAAVVDALDEPTRSGDPAGVELARWINHLPRTGLDLASIFDALVVLLDDGGSPIVKAAELLVEALYGRPYDELTLDELPTGPHSLDQGLLTPAMPLVGELAALSQDRDDGLATLSASALRSELTLDAVATFMAASGSQDPLLAGLADTLLVDLGDAIERCEDPTNDHAAGASGHSLRDLGQALFEAPAGSETKLELLLAPVSRMVADPALVDSLAEALGASSRGGHLDPLPSQFALLATTDVNGGSLEPGEDSALVSLLRLLHTADRPVSCSTIGIEWLETDNMSVWLLELIAEQEPDNVDFLLNIGGWTLSYGELIEALAGQCTIDSERFAADAPALERLVDPQVGDLLVVLLELLQALQPPDSASRIPELVEIVSLTHSQQLSEPVEELLKDLAGSRLISEVLALVPALVDPWSERAWCANGTDTCVEETWSGWDDEAFDGPRDPVDLHALLALAVTLGEPTEAGPSPLERLRASAQLLVEHPDTWTLTHNAGQLLQRPGARSAAILAQLPAWEQVDPEWKLLSMTADLLEDPACTTPVLGIVETDAVTDALTAPTEQREGPLPFISRLVVDDTLAEVLATVKLILDLLLEARP
jgi:hypothetical protein